ncbi:MAG: hypothetical protein FJ009_19495 [Chloroflexi bacterium]|nr:hypothetical protein [Chloroflexota bacterium]
MIALKHVGTSLLYQFHAPYPIEARTEQATWRKRWSVFRRAWLTPFDFKPLATADELKTDLMRLAYVLAQLFPVKRGTSLFTGENMWLDARCVWGVHATPSLFGCGLYDVEVGCIGGLSSENAISLHELSRMNLPAWQRTSYDDPPADVAENARRIMTETIRRAYKSVCEQRALRHGVSWFAVWLFVHVTTRRIKETWDGALG